MTLRLPRAWIGSLAALLAVGCVGARATAQPEPQGSAVNTLQDRHPHVSRDRDGNFIFRNEHLVAVLSRSGPAYDSLTLYPASRPTQPRSAPVAGVPLIAELGWRDPAPPNTGIPQVITPDTADHSHRRSFAPTDAETKGDDEVRLRGTVSDGGVSWQTEADISIGDGPWLSWTVRTRPSAATGLTRLTAMPVRAGHPGYREALFPGVAYLEGDEPGLPDGQIPDPRAITIPLMAVSQEETTVAVLWDNQQGWGGNGLPGARFDSPNRDEQNANHGMELFVPFAQAAAAPVSLKAGQEVSLSGKIAVLREEKDPTAAIRTWVDAFGLPETSKYPRSFSDERRLSRAAYTRSSAATPSAEAPAESSPAFRALALLIDAGLERGGGRAAELRSQAERVIDELRQQGPLDPRLAYRFGEVFRTLDALRERTLQIENEQLATGAWIPLPGPPPGQATGAEPDIQLRTVTSRVVPLLRFAARSGDSSAAGSGLRGLDYIETHFRLPRGGAPGADPDAPNLAAATEATEAFMLGYEISGERRYLDAARYWADTGLPFVYLWTDKSRAALKGASLSLMDGSGVATQEEGLRFARVLRELALVRPEGLYKETAEAILASAMHQQHASGAAAGLVPEHWNVREGRGEGADLTPDALMAVVYALLDYNTEVSHARVRVGPDRMFVASGARILSTETSAMRLRMNMKWVPEEDAFTTIVGVPERPLSVQYNTSDLRRLGLPFPRRFVPEADSPGDDGWYWDPDTGILTLRLRHTGREDHLEIRWDDPRFRSPVDRIDPKVLLRRQ